MWTTAFSTMKAALSIHPAIEEDLGTTGALVMILL
jgi:hypothetical protein